MIGITFLLLVNVFLQLLFIRLTKHYDFMSNGELRRRWSLQYWVLPFTGWQTEFKWIGGKPKYFYLTKWK